MRATRADRLLIVRHGPGRGPQIRLAALRAKFFDPLLNDLAARDPELRGSIDIWETGTALPDLSQTAAVVFLLADPLRELYPACYRDAAALAERAHTLGIRAVNPPDALSNTIKSRQAELLTRAGVPTPLHLAYATHDEFGQVVAAIRFPAIIRADLLHAQQRMIFCRTREEALAVAPAQLPLPGAVAEFVDTREGFRRSQPGSIWAESFHKKRAYVFGPHVVNNHVFFGPQPIVGGKSSSFGHYRSLNPVRRYLRTRAARPHIAADYEFFQAGSSDGEMLRRAAAALNLEFAAIDYSSRADGSIVVWELNPHFCMHPWPFEVLAGPRRLPERLRRFHDMVGTYFRELIEVHR